MVLAFCHQARSSLGSSSKERAFSSVDSCKLATRRSSVPMAEYAFSRARHTSHSPMCSAASRGILSPSHKGEALEFVCAFEPKPVDEKLPTFAQTKTAAMKHWNRFWSTGGAIDLSGSKDPRWHELERRVVLSQYLTATQSSGSWPPAETGLFGSAMWGGRFHMEMVWWHLAHFANPNWRRRGSIRSH